MNIIELAKEAGLHTEDGIGMAFADRLERFAALVRAEALEEAAKVCDKYAKNSSNPMNFAENCAAAIRSMK